MLGRWRVPLRIPREVPHPCHTYRSNRRSVLRTCAARSAGDPASPASASWAAQARGRTRSSSARTAWPCAPRSWPRRTRSCPLPLAVLPHATEALPHDVLRTAPDRPGNGARQVLPHATEAGPHDVLRTAPDRPGNGTRKVSYGTVLVQRRRGWGSWCDLRWAFSSSDLPSPAHGVGRRAGAR